MSGRCPVGVRPFVAVSDYLFYAYVGSIAAKWWDRTKPDISRHLLGLKLSITVAMHRTRGDIHLSKRLAGPQRLTESYQREAEASGVVYA